jgi:hypothetical protein
LGYDYGENEYQQCKVVQAYADDLLIFTESKENLNELASVLITFMEFTKISFNPSKCKLIINNPTGEIIPELTLPNEFGEEKVVEVCDAKQTVKYLRVPLGTKRLSKMRFNNSKLENIKKIIERLDRSGLKLTQFIDAIRIFVLPRLDYCMMNSIVSLLELTKSDNIIRKLINGRIGGPALSKSLFYTSWKNGGLDLKNLRERYFACKFNNLAHFFLRDEETRNFAL